MSTVDDNDGISKQIHGHIGRVYDESDNERVIVERICSVASKVESCDVRHIESIHGQTNDVYALIVIDIWEGKSFVCVTCESAIGIHKLDLNWIGRKVHAPKISDRWKRTREFPKKKRDRIRRKRQNDFFLICYYLNVCI